MPLNKMRLHTYLTLLLLLMSSVALHSQETKPYKVGAILALTGPVSIHGIPHKNAMLMAKEDLDKTNRLKIIFEDDGFLPRNTVAAAKKLLTQDRVDALIVYGTNQGLSIIEMTEKKKVPVLSINVNRSVVKDKNYAVLMMPSVELLTDANINGARKRGYKKVATVASMQDSCLLQRDIFEASGVSKIVESQEFEPTERDFRQIASRIITSNPDAVFLSTLPPQGSLIAMRLRQLGFKGDFFGAIQASALSELKASQGALEGAWVVSGDERKAEQFYGKYRKRFGSEPTDQSMYAYDSINLILEGLSSGDLNDFLHSVRDFTGVVGTYSSDGKNGFTFGVVAKEFTKNGYKYFKAAS